MKDFKIERGETRNHFIWRVYSYRDQIGDGEREYYGSVCRRELAEDFDESAYRKKYQYFISVWNEVKHEYIDEDKVQERLELLEEREDELYKTKIRTSDVVREKRRLLREESRIDALKDYFLDSLTRIPSQTFNKYNKKHVGDPEKVAILIISDWHVGIMCNNHWNYFNVEVMHERVEQLLFQVIKYCEINNVGTIQVVGCGDMISGSIHGTVRLFEELDRIDQSMLAAKTIFSLLGNLADFGLSVKYASVVGNHDRSNKLYKEHIEKESFNKLIDWYVSDRIDGTDLDIEYIANEIDEGIGHFNINGDDFLFVHGHQDNVKGVLSTLTQAVKMFPRAVFLGHWHHKLSFTNYDSKVFVNGCLSGVDQYAKNNRFFSVPSQSLIILDDKNIVDIDIILE